MLKEKQTDKATMFYEFMCANGYNPEDYYNLELNRPVSNSISKNMSEYKQFLLSRKVEYEDLEKYGIKGARGCIEEKGEILVPKSLSADRYFRMNNPMVPYVRHGYGYPDLSEFNSIISYHNWDDHTMSQLGQIQSVLFNENLAYYIGFIADRDDITIKNKIKLFNLLLNLINDSSIYEHKMIKDTSDDKEFYLIKRK